MGLFNGEKYMLDRNLKKYASDTQWAYMKAANECGSHRAAAKKLGVARQTIDEAIKRLRANAAKRGYSPENEMYHECPEGYSVKGTSTLYDDEGNVKIQWVKTNADQERREELIREALEALASDIPRAKPTKAKGSFNSDLMACYPIGDHHFGMLAWGEEAGADYDLEIGEDLLIKAMDHLVSVSPKCKEAVIIGLGDLMHYDSFAAVTPTSKNILDSDTRFPNLVRTTMRAIRYLIDKALIHHENVRVIIEIGNHDLASSVFLSTALENIYEKDKRVTVDTSPKQFHFFKFGKCLVGTHHGHSVKLQDLPLLMATDLPKEWGETEYRYWWTGHVHHDQVKDYTGCRVESFRILPPTDAYAENKGYRSGRDMKSIILHKDYGEVARHLVNPDMLK